MEWKESTVVRYLILLALPRPYTLECTQQALVSGGVNQVDTRRNLYKHLHAKSSGVYVFLGDLNSVGPSVSSDIVFIL